MWWWLQVQLCAAVLCGPYTVTTTQKVNAADVIFICGGFNESSQMKFEYESDSNIKSGDTSYTSFWVGFDHLLRYYLGYVWLCFGNKSYCSSQIMKFFFHFYIRGHVEYDKQDSLVHRLHLDMSKAKSCVRTTGSSGTEILVYHASGCELITKIHNRLFKNKICFYFLSFPIQATKSSEIIKHKLAMYSKNSSNYILVNYGRFSSGSDQWGPGFSNDTDFFSRSWQSDTEFRLQSTSIVNGATLKAISSVKDVANVEMIPNYFPRKLYQTAITAVGNGGGVLEYELEVDAKLDYLIWFHFAEIDVSVTRAGERVFDVLVNGENVRRVDVYKEVGGFVAYDWSYVVKNLSSTTLNVRLESVVGAPIICGLENYAIVPVDLKTVPGQVTAMRALKESLRVPDRMGWNGDPCAPTTWDAWEGVTCHPNKDDNALVISQIDLGSQGLKGYISDQIGLLTNLVSLNLSSNSLGGNLPLGLGQKSLVKLDLSNNKFTGYIPDSLTSSSLQLVLLNNNLLEGRVPEELYSVGVHGGAIDLYGNKGLCGVPSLRDCPLFWGKHGLSTGGKVAIGLSCLVIFSALALGIYYFCVWRRRNDYDFGLPHELMSLAAKRNRYQRQKSLMALEMESQHAKGFIPTYNVS
ncbi:hypothetical protein BUALT_Bualt17G0093500 [Buddleja alternifolia]|uniref:Malectin-like domain-containing protein n=1 Tax=Buddleja alternifolia TaxID=168488 RepID=A0AAV6W7A5_9LAMI|nr:hypothetical protein BUALT_Bualt17G0093500 [Buddleja alternifolia]